MVLNVQPRKWSPFSTQYRRTRHCNPATGQPNDDRTEPFQIRNQNVNCRRQNSISLIVLASNLIWLFVHNEENRKRRNALSTGMAGRSHQPNALKRREVPLSRSPTDDRRAHHRLSHSSSVGGSSRAHQTILVEDRISAQHREIQTLIYDNQRLAASHVALKQELAAADQELRHLSATAAKVKAERDAEVREVYEKSLKMDAEVHAMDAMMAELVQVRADIQKLSTVKQELSAELQAIRDGLTKASSDSQPLPPIKGEIDRMHHEIQRGR